MNEAGARELAMVGVLAAGILLYMLVHVWVPTQVVLGPVRLGSSGGDCHGLSGPEPEHTVYLALCK